MKCQNRQFTKIYLLTKISRITETFCLIRSLFPHADRHVRAIHDCAIVDCSALMLARLSSPPDLASGPGTLTSYRRVRRSTVEDPVAMRAWRPARPDAWSDDGGSKLMTANWSQQKEERVYDRECRVLLRSVCGHGATYLIWTRGPIDAWSVLENLTDLRYCTGNGPWACWGLVRNEARRREDIQSPTRDVVRATVYVF